MIMNIDHWWKVPIRGTVQIINQWVELVQSFTEEQYATSQSLYSKRNPNQSPEKEKDKIARGKFGEIAWWHYLITHGFQCTEPDFAIYTDRDKSHDPDLWSGNMAMHIKCAQHWHRYDWMSWCFRATDSALINPPKNHWFMPAMIDPKTLIVTLAEPILMIRVKENLKAPEENSDMSGANTAYLYVEEYIQVLDAIANKRKEPIAA